MSNNSPFLMVKKPCDEAVDWLTVQMNHTGLSVMRTFDLQAARHAQTDCPCPHHGTDQCDCQMIVLLVYEVNQGPITIIAHGYNGQTWFSVVDTPQQRADPHLEATIRRLAASPIPPPTPLVNHAHSL